MEGSSSEFFTHLQACHQVRELYLSSAPVSGPISCRIRQLDTNSFFLQMIALTTAHHRPELWYFPAYYGTASLFDNPFDITDTCLEHTYGITSSIASSIFLINKLWHYANNLPPVNESFASELGDALNILAKKINSWTPLSDPFSSIAAQDITTMSLARNLATSFCYSTLIYFHCCFVFNPPQSDRSMFSRLSLQTLLALERAEVETHSVKNTGAPISWPAFVAACKAPSELRQRWTKYWSALLSYQIGSQQAAWQIVQEVWRREDAGAEAAESGVIPLHAVQQVTSGTYQISEPVWTNVVKESGVTILAL